MEISGDFYSNQIVNANNLAKSSTSADDLVNTLQQIADGTISEEDGKKILGKSLNNSKNPGETFQQARDILKDNPQNADTLKKLDDLVIKDEYLSQKVFTDPDKLKEFTYNKNLTVNHTDDLGNVINDKGTYTKNYDDLYNPKHTSEFISKAGKLGMGLVPGLSAYGIATTDYKDMNVLDAYFLADDAAALGSFIANTKMGSSLLTAIAANSARFAAGGLFALAAAEAGIILYASYKAWDATNKFEEASDRYKQVNDDLIDKFWADGEISDKEAYALEEMTKNSLELSKNYMELANALENPAKLLWEALTGNKNKVNKTVSPLILDLDGDGVKTLDIANLIKFDHNANGFAELTGWVNSNDGLLVLDLNSNGTIDSGRELFGEHTLLSNGKEASGGFEALADLDSNLDGVIDANDTKFSDLKIWVDANSNGITDAGELFTLSQKNIKSIDLNFETLNKEDANGNLITQTATYTLTDDSTKQIADAKFEVDTALSKPVEDVVVSSEIQALPNVAALGNVHNLHEAMARETSGKLEVPDNILTLKKKKPLSLSTRLLAA